MTTRPPAVAGTFYPSDKEELESTIKSLYNQAADQPPVGKALIVPHAGYIYSGPVAASCYAPLAKRRNIIKKVILLGPSHYVGFTGMALPGSDFFETPLGKIQIDQDLREKALACESVIEMENAHIQEHSLEVHLPFLQISLNDFSILPVVVGQCTPDKVAALIDKISSGPETLIVISTDLSHFHNYSNAKQTDFDTAQSILSFDLSSIGPEEACGCRPVNGLLEYAKDKYKIKLIDIRNSGDTAGDKSRVVGYASFICDTPENLKSVFSNKEKNELLKLARNAIAQQLNLSCEEADTSDIENEKLATFVTLKIHGKLRGCIGTLSAHRNLTDDICSNAKAAAFEDPRFPPMSADEFKDVEISISVLTTPVEFKVSSEEDLLNKLTPGVDGLILRDGPHRSTFLPSVWEELTEPKEFISYLKQKARLPADYWSDTIQFQKYSTVIFSEKKFDLS